MRGRGNRAVFDRCPGARTPDLFVPSSIKQNWCGRHTLTQLGSCRLYVINFDTLLSWFYFIKYYFWNIIFVPNKTSAFLSKYPAVLLNYCLHHICQ